MQQLNVFQKLQGFVLFSFYAKRNIMFYFFIIVFKEHNNYFST